MIDEVEITIQGGRGGDGLISFLTEKYKPKGPPDGGSGGNGGSVYLISDTNTATLKDFSHKKLFKAENGIAGGPNGRTGACGNDLYIKVPVGTEVFEVGIITDLDTSGQTVLIAKGGKGGRGNAHMSSDKIRAISQIRKSDKSDLSDISDQSELPDYSGFIHYTGRKFSKNKHIYYAEKASDGEEKKLKLQLKLIADVGLIGLPNAGKSSLLNALTETTKASVGAYPFTTLEPNLGVLDNHQFSNSNFQSNPNDPIFNPPAGGENLNIENSPARNATHIVADGLKIENCKLKIILADIPGLIEGAYEGKGLGDKFLKHIERTKVLVHVIDVAQIADKIRAIGEIRNSDNLTYQTFRHSDFSELSDLSAYQTIREELGRWNPALLDKPEIVVLNKADLLLKTDFPLSSSIQSSTLGRPTSIIYTSTITREGIDKLKKQIIKLVLAVSKAETAAKTKKETPPFKFTLDNLPNRKIVFEKGYSF